MTSRQSSPSEQALCVPAIEDVVRTRAEEIVVHLRRRGSIQALVSEGVRTSVSTWALSRGRPVACRAGCAACCNQDVACHPTEILVLASVLRRTLKRAQLAELVARLRTHSKPEPCPLLSDKGLCTVYAARPLKCCGDHSLDALACRLDHGRHPGVQGQLEAADIPFTALILASRALDLEAGPVLLAAGLAVALSLPDAEARWRSGERIFAGTEAVLKLGRVHQRPGRAKLRVLQGAKP